MPVSGIQNRILATSANSANNGRISVLTPSLIVSGGGGGTGTGPYSVIAGGFDNLASAQYSSVGGGNTNNCAGYGCTISGGENNVCDPGEYQDNVIGGGNSNTCNGSFCVVSGGNGNTCNGANSTISGGNGNTINSVNSSIIGCGLTNTMSADTSVIAGGEGNQILIGYNHSVISGGQNNSIQGNHSTICGGNNNTINPSDSATIIGGSFNTINSACTNSVIIGSGGTISTGNYNTILLNADVGSSPATSQLSQIMMNCGTGGFLLTTNMPSGNPNNAYSLYTDNTNNVGVFLAPSATSWSAISDINKKENLIKIDTKDVLSKIGDLPIYQYNYKGSDPEIKCYGPVAQDWHKQFPSVKNNLTIETNDLVGISLAAIKGLYEKNLELEERLKKLEYGRSAARSQ